MMHHMLIDRDDPDRPLLGTDGVMNTKGRGRISAGDRVLVNGPGRSQRWYRVIRIIDRDEQGHPIRAQVEQWDE